MYVCMCVYTHTHSLTNYYCIKKLIYSLFVNMYTKQTKTDITANFA